MPAAEGVALDDALVIAGRAPDAARASLARWRGTVLADAASGLARAGTVGADLVLRAAVEGAGGHAPNAALLGALAPRGIAVVGDAVVSKRLNAWIARQECPVTVFGAGDPRVDPAHRASAVHAGPVEFRASRATRPHAGWTRALKCARTAAIRSLAAERALSEPVALLRALDAAAGLRRGTVFLGSSMPIRDVDFLALSAPAGWDVGANRGASGIDGLVATAAGHAAATGAPVLAVVGDVSALHDLNSLHLAAEVRTPMVVVVLNNDGGGIFRMLPIARHADVFERCFTTPHGLRLAPVARALGIAADAPRTPAAFVAAVRAGLRGKGLAVVEAVVDPRASEACRARVHAAAAAALAREFR
jgi:2-succinyl-5-enolpyruvyl-6-hydroxy-3-cyclohexene-1-carboxylate synthase